MSRALWGLPLWVVGIAAVVLVAGGIWVAGGFLGLVGSADYTTPPMPAKLEDMTGTAFRDHVRQLEFLKFRGQTRDRACVQGSGTDCQTAQSRTSVRILAEKGSSGIGPGNIHVNGHIVGLLSNRRDATEARYQLPPNADSIYWLVERGQSDTVGVSRFVRLLPNGGWEVLGQPHLFEKCVHTEPRPGWTKADFRECVSTGSLGLAFLDDSLEIALRSAWVSCLAGCCIAR